MVRVTGRLLGNELCKALDINPELILSIEVICKFGESAEAVIHRHLTDPEIALIAELVTGYELVEKESASMPVYTAPQVQVGQ